MSDRSKGDLTLDELGMSEGTTKSSLRMDYLRHYEEMLSAYRDQELNLIEMGVQNGGSLPIWEAFFSKAVIVGIDINEKSKRYATQRSIVEIGSQADPQFLARVAGAHSPTIVVDDGSHRADYTIFSFETLFPLLRPGGCYVIEDLFLHFGASAGQWRGEATSTPIAYFQRLFTSVLGRPTVGGDQTDPEVFSLIDRCCAIAGALFVWKHPPESDLMGRIARAKEVVARTDRAVSWFYLAIFVLKTGGPPEEAEWVARRAVALEPSTRTYRVLSQALQARGELDGPIEAMQSALTAAKRPHEQGVASKGLAALVARRERGAVSN